MPTLPLGDATVVQLIGAVGHGDPLVDGAELGRWLAQKLHASFRFLSAPLLVEDEGVAQALRRERTIEETLALAARAEVAIIGIGTPEPDQSSLLRAGYLTRAELQALLDQGIVGDVVAHQFDANGHRPDIPANRRAISLDAESLQRIPLVMAVSGGRGKIAAIHAALLGRFCTCLVTDAIAARGVLQMHATRQESRVAAWGA